MFLMGEEVGATQDYTYNEFLQKREDLNGMRIGSGARLFRFYQDIIEFRKAHVAVRSDDIRVLYTHNENRILVFERWSADERLLAVANLHDRPFPSGYWIYSPDLPDGVWREVFNSDAAAYGGENVGNAGGRVESRSGYLGCVVPRSGFVVFRAM
jgi:1,4-alpha-glucan branching enzyme